MYPLQPKKTSVINPLKNHIHKANDQRSLNVCLKWKEENHPFLDPIDDINAQNSSFQCNQKGLYTNSTC